MKRSLARLKMRLKKPFIFIAMFALALPAGAAQLNLMGGFYSLNARTQKNEGKDSNLGVYQISYQTELIPKIAIQMGYSLMLTQTFSGDMGFGPDISLMYFPFTETQAVKVDNERMVFRSSEILRPYVSAGFHQRQFQSVSSTYVGFGAEVGASYYFSPQYDLRGALRTMMLRGPNQAEATEFDLLIGLGINF